jgi:hypothetical protein
VLLGIVVGPKLPLPPRAVSRLPKVTPPAARNHAVESQECSTCRTAARLDQLQMPVWEDLASITFSTFSNLLDPLETGVTAMKLPDRPYPTPCPLSPSYLYRGFSTSGLCYQLIRRARREIELTSLCRNANFANTIGRTSVAQSACGSTVTKETLTFADTA